MIKESTTMKPEQLLEKPTPPAEGECCDNACDPCVWDHYYQAMKDWRKQQAEIAIKEEEK